MIRQFLMKAQQGHTTAGFLLFNQKRWVHSRNKKAMEFIAKGYGALQEVDRVIDYAEFQDKRLIPLLRTAKENFELALEADNSNTHARYWLARLHMKYHVPGACKAVGVVIGRKLVSICRGAALLVEAANMGDKNAQYELGCKLRVENPYVNSVQQAFYYLEKAADQFHPGALYLLGAVYLTGDCVNKDGHAGAAIAYGSLLLKGVEIPESIAKLRSQKAFLYKRARKDEEICSTHNRVEMAKEQFEIAARGGCDLGLRWLDILEKEEKQLLSR
ncbi:hypothetical protein G4B88_010667 [Cannabis sativa]|uniref:Binding protein n=1 Tax=Cannabis sativa TaxID=3483 RepID=A0A7J6EQH4_CANSA|nr:hypothetical protein G4B88_010667 [Cannabis sativa]